MDGQSLRALFESLNDPLGEKGRKQPMGRTLTMVFLAMVSGENSLRGIGAWLEEQRWRLKKIFGYRRDDMPSYSTIRRALQAVDVVELEKKLAEWAKALSNSDPSIAWAGIAIDGKYLKGSTTTDHKA